MPLCERARLTQATFDASFDAATDASSSGFFDGGIMARWRSMHRENPAPRHQVGPRQLRGGDADHVGPFTRFGGNDATFRRRLQGSVDIYLDPPRSARQGF